jgi:carboxyl-terminal processing protease
MSRLIKAYLSILVVILIASSIAGCSLFKTPAAQGSSFSQVDEAWGIISREYVDKSKVDQAGLGRAAVKGMVDGLNDPYSTYLDPQEYALSITHQQGQFGGIGATVGVRDGQVIVTAPIAGTPAEKAGVKAGDAILAVDGKSTAGMGVEQVVLLIRGAEGTPVTITILHEGASAPVDLTITRGQIDVPSVSYEMKDTIAYFRISYFSERTDDEMMPLLSNLPKTPATGIIIDLRGNPGGPVDTVVNIASHFIPSGIVLSIVDNAGREVTYNVKNTGVRTTLPVVLLTDNFSASGSEVLSGAIQDHKRGIIAGDKTFGKGSADRWFQLSDGSAIYLTTSRWLTPNRRLIEGKGIEPDFKLDLKGNDLVQWAIDYLKKK